MSLAIPAAKSIWSLAILCLLWVFVLTSSPLYAASPNVPSFPSGNDTTPPVLLNVPPNDTLDCSDPIPADPVTAIDDHGPVTLIPTNSVSAFECSPGLAAWWPAEGNGNDAQSNLNASLINGTTFSTGIAGDAFALDGVDDYLEVTDTVSYRTRSYSNAFWIKTSDSTDQVIYSASDTTTGVPRVLIKLTPAGQVQFTHNTPQGPANGTTITTSLTNGINDGQWHQLIVRKADSVMSIRVDNMLQATGVDTNDFNQPLIVTIGRLSFLNFTNNENFEGTIDEVRVYSRALCAQEIQALYLAGQNGTWAPTFRLTRTWNAFDGAGNFTSAQQVIIFDDITPPILIPPAPLNIACTDPNGVPRSNPQVRNWLNSAFATDSCSCVILTFTAPPVFESACNGFTTLITFSATDECGNITTGSSTITVYDSAAPTAICPADIVVGTDPGTCSAVVNYNVTGEDLCGSTTLSLSDSSGSTFALGTHTVMAVATDQCGYTDSCSFTVTVEDQEAPTFANCPGDIALDICNPVATWTPPTATDACSSVSITAPTFSPGDAFPEGNTTVSYTATDAAGNTSTCSFVVSISAQPLVVTGTVPTFGSGTQISCNGFNDGSIDIGVTGGCPPYTYQWNNGSSSQDMNNLIAGNYALTVTDQSGNQAVFTADLNEPAPLAVAATITDDSCGNLNGGSIDLVISGGAICQPNTVSLTGPNGFQSSNLSNTGLDAGTYDLLVSDVNGCSFAATYDIQLSDTEAPQANCQDVTVTLDANGTYQLSAEEINNGSSDNCGIDSLLLGNGPITFTCANLGTHSVQLRVVDASGNSSTCTATVTVVEETVLAIQCPGDLVTSCNGPNGAYVSWDLPTASISGPCTNLSSEVAQPGFKYLGKCNGSRYYRSLQARNWMDAQQQAEAVGGHLVVINSASENHFVRQSLQSNVAWIGYTDRAVEGTFEWVDGSSTGFTYWKNGDPDNAGGNCSAAGALGQADFAVIKQSNGRWLDRKGCQLYQYIVEVDEGNFLDVEQVAGPARGSFFPVGTTPVTYITTDGLGDTVSCTFNVTVEECPIEYCHAGGMNTHYEWIEHIGLNNLSHTSGNDQGYGDHTQIKEVLTAGSQANITLTPGFQGCSYREYWKVWIDWNRDGDFYDSGEMVFYGNGHSPLNGTISVPANAAQGELRMRVAMRWNCYPSGPCCYYQYGEVEDYTIEVGSGNARAVPGALTEPQEVVVGESVQAASGMELSNLYPNPVSRAASGEVALEFRAEEAQSVTLKINDLYGQVLIRQQLDALEGLNREFFSLRDLPAGTYLVVLQSKAGQERHKVVVQ